MIDDGLAMIKFVTTELKEQADIVGVAGDVHGPIIITPIDPPYVGYCASYWWHGLSLAMTQNYESPLEAAARAYELAGKVTLKEPGNAPDFRRMRTPPAYRWMPSADA